MLPPARSSASTSRVFSAWRCSVVKAKRAQYACSSRAYDSRLAGSLNEKHILLSAYPFIASRPSKTKVPGISYSIATNDARALPSAQTMFFNGFHGEWKLANRQIVTNEAFGPQV